MTGDWRARWEQAMAAELDWAPIHFDNWRHYETARPYLDPTDTLKLLGEWSDQGITIYVRDRFGEVISTLQTPLDHTPTVTVHGTFDPGSIERIRAVGIEAIPVPVHRPLPVERLIDGEGFYGDPVRYLQPSRATTTQAITVTGAYREAGHHGLRLGPPVGTTTDAQPVFEPIGWSNGSSLEGVRLAVERSEQPGDVRIGVYRPEGVDWSRTSTFERVSELQRFVPRAIAHHVESVGLRAAQRH